MRALLLIGAVLLGASAPAVAAPEGAPLRDGAAAPGAVAAGAALIAEGEALGKAGKYELALARFRAAASGFPSASHDCYVELTYFRLGGLTAARLYLDGAHRRGDEVPGWCSGRLEDQLTAELTRRGYVPVEITITPADAIVGVGDVRVVGGRRAWLPPGPVVVTGERAGYDRQFAEAVTAAGAVIALRLRRPRAPVARAPRPWLAYGALAGGAALVAGGVAFHLAALDQRDAADRYYRDDPRFAPLDARFQRDRGLALGGYVVGAAAISTAVYLLVRRARTRMPVEVALTPERVLVSWSIGGG